MIDVNGRLCPPGDGKVMQDKAAQDQVFEVRQSRRITADLAFTGEFSHP